VLIGTERAPAVCCAKVPGSTDDLPHFALGNQGSQHLALMGPSDRSPEPPGHRREEQVDGIGVGEAEHELPAQSVVLGGLGVKQAEQAGVIAKCLAPECGRRPVGQLGCGVVRPVRADEGRHWRPFCAGHAAIMPPRGGTAVISDSRRKVTQAPTRRSDRAPGPAHGGEQGDITACERSTILVANRYDGAAWSTMVAWMDDGTCQGTPARRRPRHSDLFEVQRYLVSNGFKVTEISGRFDDGLDLLVSPHDETNVLPAIAGSPAKRPCQTAKLSTA